MPDGKFCVLRGDGSAVRSRRAEGLSSCAFVRSYKVFRSAEIPTTGGPNDLQLQTCKTLAEVEHFKEISERHRQAG